MVFKKISWKLLTIDIMRKTKISTYALYAFYIFSIANLIAQVAEIAWIDFATKPFLMISLLLFYATGKTEKSSAFSNLIASALIFSLIGDILLMLQGQFSGLFIFGLGAFLIAHICYIFGFRKARFDEPGEINNSFVHTRIVFLLLIGGALIYMLYPNLKEMLLPVVLYTIVIISMGISALIRRGWTPDNSFIMVYSGALLFIMSDALLGINKFMNPIWQARLLIMATYIAAQLLIVKGILIHERELARLD